jgi:hypothetical protein
MKSNLARTLMVAALGMAAIGNRASADTSYTIDSTLSSLNVAVYLGGPPGTGTLVTLPQAPGSDTATLSGFLNATVGGNISFGGGSNVVLNNQPGVFLPDANGGDSTGPDPAGTGGAPASIALSLDPSIGLGTGFIAISGATSDVTNFAPGGTALTAGTFDATQQNILVTNGSLAYWLNTVLGLEFGQETVATPTSPLSAQNGVDSGGNTTPLLGTAVVVGNLTTIVLPIFADQSETLSGLPIDIVFSGTIVATAVASAVPEPGTFGMMGVAMVGLGLAGWARRRRDAK